MLIEPCNPMGTGSFSPFISLRDVYLTHPITIVERSLLKLCKYLPFYYCVRTPLRDKTCCVESSPKKWMRPGLATAHDFINEALTTELRSWDPIRTVPGCGN